MGDEKRRMVLVEICDGMLEEVMQMPKGAKIVKICHHTPEMFRRAIVLQLVVEGIGSETDPCEEIPTFSPTLTEAPVVKWDWSGANKPLK